MNLGLTNKTTKERIMSVDDFNTWANWALVGSLAVGVVATYVVVWSGNIKDAKLKKELAASAERTAQLEKEAAISRFELEQLKEKQKPRMISDEKQKILVEELKGKIALTIFVVQPDTESKFFALQLQVALQEAGSKIELATIPVGENLSALPTPLGVIMYSPKVVAGSCKLEDDPLYIALKKVDMYGGNATVPFLSPEKLSLGPMLARDAYILYIGPKSIW